MLARIIHQRHGRGGELDVQPLRDTNPLSHAFVEAAKQAGHAHNTDFNGAEQEGVGLYQVTQRNGERCSAAKAYLAPPRFASRLPADIQDAIRRHAAQPITTNFMANQHHGAATGAVNRGLDENRDAAIVQNALIAEEREQAFRRFIGGNPFRQRRLHGGFARPGLARMAVGKPMDPGRKRLALRLWQVR